MDDEPHILLVNAHAKRYRCHYNINDRVWGESIHWARLVICKRRLLCARPGREDDSSIFLREAGMVASSADLLRLERVGHLLALIPGGAVDDATNPFHSLSRVSAKALFAIRVDNLEEGEDVIGGIIAAMRFVADFVVQV